MKAAVKLQEFAKVLGASRSRSKAASIVPGPPQTTLVATENATVDNASIRLEGTPPPDEAERESEATTANQARSPLTGVDLDAAIRLRWVLRDIKAERTKLTPVSPSDLKALIEMGLLEMHDEVLVLTNEGHQALDQ